MSMIKLIVPHQLYGADVRPNQNSRSGSSSMRRGVFRVFLGLGAVALSSAAAIKQPIKVEGGLLSLSHRE